MSSGSAANTWRTSRPAAQCHSWTPLSGSSPVTVLQTAWLGLQPVPPSELPGSRPSNAAAGDHATAGWSPGGSRRHLLHRSLLDLVAAHAYLPLTDSKLLDWYLRLSPGDRDIVRDAGGLIQFLQRHPALQLSSHHVQVKYSSGSAGPAQPAMTSYQRATPGAKECRCETHLEWELLPRNVRQSLTLLGCSNDRTGAQLPAETTKEVHLQDSFHTASSSPVTERRQKTQFSLSEEGRAWQTASGGSSAAVWGRPELRSRISETQGQSAEFGPSVSGWLAAEEGSLSEHHRVDTIHSDMSVTGSVEREEADPPLQENTIKEDMVRDGGDDEASLSFEDQSETFHSILEDDTSILVCLPEVDLIADDSGVPSCPVSDAAAASSETASAADSGTSPPCVVVVGAELAPCTSASTQTEGPETADKHVITEVRLAEEFIRLTTTQDPKEPKQEAGSSGWKLREDCDCVRRAQRAELRLLALQYSMCTQHCWRLYYTSAEGSRPTPTEKDPPANVVRVLQQLDSDYNQMKHEILAGVPLEQLQPLTVDSEKIAAGARYAPAPRIAAEELGNAPSGTAQEPQVHPTSGEDDGRHGNGSRNGCQVGRRKDKRVQRENGETRRPATVVPEDRAACEADTSEAWFDAEEDLELPGPAVTAEVGQEPTGRTDESAGGEVKRSVLSVSNPPSGVTELTAQPPLQCSINNRKPVCMAPTAQGTYVPQHYGTMGSFDTLMAELMQRHPDVGRQRIVDALIELRLKHRGVLSGLPLRTIREMTSELLTRPATATQ